MFFVVQFYSFKMFPTLLAIQRWFPSECIALLSPLPDSIFAALIPFCHHFPQALILLFFSCPYYITGSRLVLFSSIKHLCQCNRKLRLYGL